MPIELPLVTPVEPRERADARRNRERILCAAERLIRAHGIEGVSMDDVASEAGVGKGTLYRRFGDRSQLLFALLNDEESGLQETFIRGEPPLGPGAPPPERLHAFGDAMIDLLERRGELFLAAESEGRPGTRYLSRPYIAYR
ncbi:MAG: TetR/AcrR family transcriptional regulator, partial [Solirubrobacterales bacterium]|nr:TetR/AcrR family transcriptional regulator [Solirubrobacterales bacterium]